MRTLTTMLVVVVGALAFAACGGDDKSAASKPNESADVFHSPKAPPCLERYNAAVEKYEVGVDKWNELTRKRDAGELPPGPDGVLGVTVAGKGYPSFDEWAKDNGYTTVIPELDC